MDYCETESAVPAPPSLDTVAKKLAEMLAQNEGHDVIFNYVSENVGEEKAKKEPKFIRMLTETIIRSVVNGN